MFLYYFELNQIRASSASSNNSVGNSGIEIRETGLNWSCGTSLYSISLFELLIINQW